jgi:flagellar basal body-associated protein FliL
VARARAGGLARKTGINAVPIIVFVVVAAVAGGGLFAWDYFWRQRQEEATRPPAPDVLVRNLVESIIGRGTVKDVKIDAAAGTASVTFESATFKPEQAEKDPQQYRVYLSSEAELASGIILRPIEPVAAQVPQLLALKQVSITIVYQGTTIATAVAERGKKIQVTFVDPRLK